MNVSYTHWKENKFPCIQSSLKPPSVSKQSITKSYTPHAHRPVVWVYLPSGHHQSCHWCQNSRWPSLTPYTHRSAVWVYLPSGHHQSHHPCPNSLWPSLTPCTGTDQWCGSTYLQDIKATIHVQTAYDQVLHPTDTHRSVVWVYLPSGHHQSHPCPACKRYGTPGSAGTCRSSQQRSYIQSSPFHHHCQPPCFDLLGTDVKRSMIRTLVASALLKLFTQQSVCQKNC